jgi:hypothetical protein
MSIGTRLRRLERAAAGHRPLQELSPKEMTEEQLAECIARCERRLHAAGLLRRAPLTAEQVQTLNDDELRRLVDELPSQHQSEA